MVIKEKRAKMLTFETFQTIKYSDHMNNDELS
jgi:hypothetical protein